MVRVISVHHFTGQHIETVEQPTACTVAAPNKLLLALTSNCVEVRDLRNESDVLFSFPTVDEVIQILHSRHGDFVATLETKFNRQNKETNFVRVYVNWDSVAALQQSKMTSSGISLGSSECGMVQPMRARIAGRVTPTTNQSELGSLEMIEIPVVRNPSRIVVCQISGNLGILSGRHLNFYQFKIKTHDISKLKFIDFEQLQFDIELPFVANLIEMAENYIGVMNQDNMYMFRVEETKIRNHTELNDNYNYDFRNQDDTIDFAQLLKDEKLNPNSMKLTVHLPTITRNNCIIHKNSPFTFSDKDMVATITDPNYEIKHLIQLKLVPVLIESPQRQITEGFKSLVIKPIYVDKNFNKNHESPCLNMSVFRSDYRKDFAGVICILATQQEGYLYYFNEFDSIDADHCITVYPFTAPVQDLVVEDYFLHALTETGLESYTLRFGHKLCSDFQTIDDINVACPSVNDSICLVGLRPFLGVEKILLTEQNLVLLANSETSPTHSVSSNSSSNAAYWTLYNLELPNPKTIFNDISIVANMHRFTSVQTYRHLLSETHIILRVALILRHWTITDDNVKLIIPIQLNDDNIVETYRTSCALLGDHYVMCSTENQYKLAIPYYKMARVSPSEVLKRVKKIQEQSNSSATKGLIYYLKHILFELYHSRDIEKFLSDGSKQNSIENILDLLVSYNVDELPNLILKSAILREYSTDKLIGILIDKLSREENDERYLALAVLYVQKCNTQKSLEYIAKISRNNLQELLRNNWELLFDIMQKYMYKSKNITFSELSVVLIGSYAEDLATVLADLIIEKKNLSLNKMLRIFLEYLPSSIGSDSNLASLVLQKTFELYFQHNLRKIDDNSEVCKIMYEKGSYEALKLLVRSYLSQLQILQLKEETRKNEPEPKSDVDEKSENSDSSYDKSATFNPPYFDEKKSIKNSYLFSSFRHEYLDKMPPFQIEITSKLYEVCIENYTTKDIESRKNSTQQQQQQQQQQPNEEADLMLKKLQAILCSQIVQQNQIIGEVEAFLTLNENLRGNISLRSIILNNNDAVLLLIDNCPQCLLQFGKDRFMKTDEWKFLIATVQRRILYLNQNEALNRVCFFHKKILKDILTYVATTMTLDQLVQVFPQRFSTSTPDLTTNTSTTTSNNQLSGNNPPTSDKDNRSKQQQPQQNIVYCDLNYLDNELDILNEIQNYEPYVIICKETMHANQINKLITTTGQQLLSTLNL